MAATSGASPLKGRWTIWIIALVFSLLSGLGVLTIIGSAADTKTYYVVTTDVAPRTPISIANTEPRTMSADGFPDNALSLAQVESGALYSKIPLLAGEMVTESNTGELEPITSAMPEGYVAVSLSVSPDNAVAGRVKPGDLVDIAAVSDSVDGPLAKVILSGVLVLDVSVAPASIAAAANDDAIGSDIPEGPGPDSVAARNGIPQLYTFAVSLQDFATLALLRDKNVYLALSRPEDADTDRTAEAIESDLFRPGVPAPKEEPPADETPASDAPATDAPASGDPVTEGE